MLEIEFPSGSPSGMTWRGLQAETALNDINICRTCRRGDSSSLCPNCEPVEPLGWGGPYKLLPKAVQSYKSPESRTCGNKTSYNTLV